MAGRGIVEGSATALSTSPAAIALELRDGAIMSGLFIRLASVSGATSLTIHLAADAGGLFAVSPQQTVDIVSTGVGLALDDVVWHAPSWGTAGRVWVVIATNTGTATGTPALTWRA